MGHLDFQGLAANLHQVFGAVGEEDALIDFGGIALPLARLQQVDGIGAGRHHHPPVGVLWNLQLQGVVVVPFGIDLAVLHYYIDEGALPQKAVDKAAVGLVVEILWGVNLHNLAHVADHHPVGDSHSLRLIVGDKDDGEVKFPLELLDFKAHGLPELGIQVGEGLIQQHHLGLGDDGAGQGDALLLPAGKVGGEDLLQAGEAGMLHGLLYPLGNFGFIDLLNLEGEGHIVKDVHVGPDGKGLEDHPQPPLLRRHIEVFILDRNGAAAKLDLPLAQVLKASNHPQRGGLAAAGGAQEGEALPLVNAEVKVVHSDDIPQCLGGKPLGNMTKNNLIHPLNPLPVLGCLGDDGVADDDYDDSYASQRRRLGNHARVAQGVDLDAQGAGIGSVQQDGGGHLTHGRQENEEEAGDHGRTDERQGDVGEALHMGGAAGAGRLLQGGVNLQERCGGALHGEGEIPGNVGHQDNPDGVIKADIQDVAGPGQNDADGQHGAGEGVGQHRENLQHLLALGPDLLHHIGDEGAQEHTDDTGGNGDKEGVLHRINGAGGGEDALVVLEGEVLQDEGQAIGLHQAHQENHHQGHDDDEDQGGDAEDEQRDAGATELDEGGAHTLALDDVVAAGAEDLLLNHQGGEHHQHQHDGEGRALADSLKAAPRTGDNGVNLGGQGIDALGEAQNGGNAEMGQGGGENQQGTGRDGGHHQGEGYLADNGHLLSASDAGAFLQGGVHPLQGADHLHKDEGEVVGQLHKDDTPKGVDVHRGGGEAENLHQELVEVAGPAVEQQVPGHGPQEGGEHIGDVEEGAHQPLGGDVAAAQQPGVEGAYNGPQQGDPKGDFDGVPHGGQVARIGKLAAEELGVKVALEEKGVVDDGNHRNHHYYQQQHHGEGGHHAVHAKALAIDGGKILIAACFCHADTSFSG